MTYDSADLPRVRNPVLAISAVAWLLLLIPGSSLSHAHCSAMSPPSVFAAGWALMLVAMMAPVLIPPIRYLRLRSFTHRRTRTIALFVAGYAIIWILLGAVFRILVRHVTLSAWEVLAVALVWQASPIKQRCLNRCHAHPELAAFGAAADLDAGRYGLTHALWCACSCWALMLFPMLLTQGQMLAMAAATLLIFSERLESPAPPRWRWHGPRKLTRILIAQSRIRLQSLSYGRA